MDDRFKTLEKYNLWGGNDFPTGCKRQDYLDRILSYTGNRLIKVLVGQRRVGKSYLLRQLASHLANSGVNPRNIFFINCELSAFYFLKTNEDLDSLFNLYLKQINPQGRIYLFIDEIQNVEGWERFANSYSQDYTAEYELFISGSNSKMLSGELATLLAGRYVEFAIYPFSYTEFLGITQKENNKVHYLEYMQSSGMPELYHLSQPEVQRNYISALKDTVLLRDIIQRQNIKDAKLLEDIFVYLVNNASNLISIRNITNYFKSSGRKTSYDTIASYISYIEDTFLVHKVEKYQIKGKETIAGNCKYYINDLGFNNYLYQGFGYGIGYKLENLIYLDLLRAGYQIYVGSIKNKEVDFVAIKGERVIYLQSTYLLIDKETIEREYASLEAIEDNYEKIVVSLDDLPLPSKEGIKHVQAWNLSHAIL